MIKLDTLLCGWLATTLVLGACKREAPPPPAPPTEVAAPAKAEMPPLDANNIVSIAIASKDHSTLVAALKAADYVTAIANPAPLTGLAATNSAFPKLPAHQEYDRTESSRFSTTTRF